MTRLLLVKLEELEVALTADGSGNPSAFDMGGTIEPSASTASPTPHVRAILLRLVPAIFATN